jgi:hypothetical protein
MDIQLVTIIDLSLLVMGLWCILRVSEWSIFNPSLWWVALHAFGVTLRLIALAFGAQSLSVIGIRSDMELVRAGIASDLSLMGVVAACVYTAFRTRRGEPGDAASAGKDGSWLNPYAGYLISGLCLTIGTYALLKFGLVATAARARGIDISAINIGGFAESSYPFAIAGSAVQGALILCAMRGFTRWRLLVFVILLGMTSVNLARTSFVLPTILAFLIFQSRRHAHSIPLKWVIMIPVFGLVWFVFKPVAAGIRAGDDPRTIFADAGKYFAEQTTSEGSLDTELLDCQATYMAAADEQGKRYYGATLLPLVYLPIPRFVWPDKPLPNEWSWELSSSVRRMAPTGMTAQLSGESYVNFGWIGCVVIPFLYILGMQMFYRRVRNHDLGSVAHWIYLVLLISMVQVFRDGLNSLFVYPCVTYLPLVAWGGVSKAMGMRRAKADSFNLHHGVTAQTGRSS